MWIEPPLEPPDFDEEEERGEESIDFDELYEYYNQTGGEYERT